MAEQKKSQKHRSVTKGKWGIIFLLPFALAFFAFQLYPLVATIYNSFFKNFMDGLTQVGPEFVGLENFKTLFEDGHLLKYAANTLIMWLIGFVPQILISLLLASWFANHRLRIRAAGFFKTVIYMPNLIMASAFAMLFFALFSDIGPVNAILQNMGFEQFRFFSSIWATRILVGFMNFLMWFGNTTILLMAGIMGIDPALFEAAEVDGARPGQIFRQITLPILRPILLYVMLTSMIGGIQMFDVPQILTDGSGSPVGSSMTLIMWLNQHMYSKNYGMGGALSVILLFITAILSLLVFKFMVKKED